MKQNKVAMTDTVVYAKPGTVRTYHIWDKKAWSSGPWIDEPDKAQWEDEATSLPCLITRGADGAFCGYVSIEPSHPLYGHDYESVDVNVHGGLTYSGACRGGASTEPETPDYLWRFGFSCGHDWDFTPEVAVIVNSVGFSGQRLATNPFHLGGVYRDFTYVTGQCHYLAMYLFQWKEK